MRSAYLVLGVPGDASTEEIETAFRKAEQLAAGRRQADADEGANRLNELRSAYQVLRDPEARAAHDRKLQQLSRPVQRPRTPAVQEEEASPARKMMIAGFLLVAVLFCAGAALNWRNQEVRKQQAAAELAARKASEAEAARKQADEERQAAARAAMAAQAEANERRLAIESQAAAARASANIRAVEANMAAMRRAEVTEQQRREARQAEEDRRSAAEARQRTERDKQRVRELCYQQYRRADC